MILFIFNSKHIMKKFLKQITGIGILGILVVIGIEFLLLTVPNEYSYKRKYIDTNGDGIQTLILGHSHAANGINPELLGDSVFNLAISGRLHYYDAVLVERYIPKLKNLQCVVWPLGYNFQYDSYKYPCIINNNVDYSSTYLCMYEKYMDITYNYFIPYMYWSEIINSKLNYGLRIFKHDQEQMGCTQLGFEPAKQKNKTHSWKTEHLPVIVNYESLNAQLAFSEGLSNMKRIAKVCSDNQVRLIVVTMPCYKTYKEKMTERGLKEMQACVDTMHSVYPNLEYYNFISDSRFKDDDFYNSSHLSDVGAEKFSKILRSILRN